MNLRTALDRDAIIEQLSRLDSSDPGDAATDQPPSTVRELKAELDTLLGELQAPVAPDPFSDETGLRRAQELVLAIGVEPESKTRDDRLELGRIGPYELLEKLGEGGMGAVYKALHSSLEKIVALKVLPHDRLSPQAISRFKREMKAVGKLDHPNIVRATDAGEAGGDHFLVMEYVDGVDLAELLRRVGPLPAAEACELVRQAAVGLQHAHQRGMVHRDIKPNNIMLAWSDEHAPAVKILDMGLALLSEQKTPAHGDLTTTGQMMGTLEYMSPEQGLDTHNVDIRADIYSLGATLYKLLCGKAPFSGERYNTPGKLMVALATETPPSIGAKRDDLPDGLAALVDRMLAREPADRPATPAEVAQRLAAFAAGADLRRLADAARQHGSSTDKSTDQSITPTKLHLSSPSTGTSPGEGTGWDKSARPTTPPVVSAKMVGLEYSSHPTNPNPKSTLRNPKWLAAIAAGLLALAAGVYGIIKILTPDGDYVIQTDDPDFSFSVSKEVVTLHDKKTKRKYTMKVVREDNGVFELDVTDVGADLSFKVKEFTIKRGQQVALKAHFERKPEDVMKGPQSTDPDRRAAEWVLSIGGTLEIDVVGRLREKVTQIDALPSRRFAIWSVEVARPAQVDDVALENIGQITALNKLSLQNQPITDAGLAKLSEMPGLTNITDLWFLNARITDEGLVHLKRFPNLETLDLIGSQVTGTGFKYLRELPRLKELSISATPLAVNGAAELRGLQLRYLGLGGCLNITDADMEHVGTLTSLRGLELTGTQFGDAGLARLESLINLERLNINETRVTGEGLKTMRHFEKLNYLGLYALPLSDADLANLRDLPLLETLILSKVPITDASLEHLPSIQGLKSVNLQETKVTEAGVKKLSAALPGCKIEWDGGVIEPSLSTKPDRRAAEWVLSVGGWVRVNDQDGDIKVVNDLPREPFRLTRFDLSRCQPVTDAGLAVLKDCKHLTSVNLVETQLTDAGTVHFKDYPQLQELSLAHTALTDAGLVHFQNCKNLKLLWLGVTQVSDIGLSNFQGCKNLTQLWLGGTKLTDAGLIHFKECKDLTNLSVMNTKVTDAGLANFQDRKKFTHLWLGGTKLTDLGLSYLQGCENLTLLWLEGTKLTDAGLVHFKDCKELTSLSLDDTQVTDAGLAHFQECKKLTHVWLGRTQVSETGLANFRECKDLTELYLTGTLVGDTGLTDFAKFANLSYIDLTKTKVTEAGVKKLSAALPGCKIEWDGGVIEPSLSTNPDRRAAEWVLSIGGTISFNENGQERETKAVGDLPHGAFELTAVDLEANKNVSDAGLGAFQGCKNLTSVNLRQTQVSDAGLAHFQDCKNLVSLDLGDTKVSDAGLEQLAGYPQLVLLKVMNSQVTKAGVKKFSAALPARKIKWDGDVIEPRPSDPDRRAAEWVLSIGGHIRIQENGKEGNPKVIGELPRGPFELRIVDLTQDGQVNDSGLANLKDCNNLTHLFLQAPQVSDAGLAHVKDCKNLTLLTLRRTKVTAAGLDDLKKALPNCKIEWDDDVIEPDGNATPPVGKADPPSSDYDRLATGTWLPVRTAPDVSRNARLIDGLIEIQDGHAYDRSVQATDVIVRAKVQKLRGQNVLLTLRDVKGVYYSGFYHFDETEGFGVGMRGVRFKYGVKEEFEASFDVPEGEFFELAFAAIGDTLTVYANGKRVGAIHDSAITQSGGVAVHATKGKGVFKDVEVMVLDKPQVEATAN